MANKFPECGIEVRQPLLLRLNNTTIDTDITLDRLESLLNDFAQAIEHAPAAASGGCSAQPVEMKSFSISSIANDAHASSVRLHGLTDRLSELLSRL